MKRIFVSATSIKSGGALSILKQFILNADGINQYHLALNKDIELPDNCLNKPNFHYLYITERNRVDRIKWDFWGAYQWIKKTGLNFDCVISLQNTSLNVAGIPQLIYLHQSLILHPKSWRFIDKQERKYAFYKYIYPLFVFCFANKTTHFIIQTEWMRQALAKKYRIDLANISNIKPSIAPWQDDTTQKTDTGTAQKKQNNSMLNLFYPSTDELFKNHMIVLKSLKNLDERGVDLSRLSITFTIDLNKASSVHIQNYLRAYPTINKCIQCIGSISYEQVKKIYDTSDAVLFPSEIESFGLPLLESAMLGKQILSLDTDFSKEVLAGYPGVCFIKNEASAWADRLSDLMKAHFSNEHPCSYEPFQAPYPMGWDDFFKLKALCNVS